MKIKKGIKMKRIIQMEGSKLTLDTRFVLRHGLYVDPSKLNQGDWHEVLNSAFWRCYSQDKYISTVFPDINILNKEVFWGKSKFFIQEKIYQRDEIKIHIAKPARNVDFELKLDTKMIPLSQIWPCYNDYFYSHKWAKNNTICDQFILKVSDFMYQFVILTRTLGRKVHFSPNYYNIHTKKYSFKCVGQDVIDEMCVKDPQLGMRILSTYLGHLDRFLAEREDFTKRFKTNRDLVFDVIDRMTYKNH